MRALLVALATTTIMLAAPPTSAAIVSLASNVDLSGSPFTVNIGKEASYTFSYMAGSYSPVSIAMSGTGEVYGNGFFSPNGPDPLQIDVVVPDQLSLGEFFKQTGSAPIPYSIALVDVALRFSTRGRTYFGYAQVGGSFLTQFAYNDTPGGSISTGQAPTAVPEPTAWAMLIAGFGGIGAAMRGRRRITASFA